MIPLVLAHAGKVTWDELLYMGVPVLILVILGWQARRKGAEHDEREHDKRGDEEG